jgi:cytochrome c-type biogenesis protein CcmF
MIYRSVRLPWKNPAKDVCMIVGVLCISFAFIFFLASAVLAVRKSLEWGRRSYFAAVACVFLSSALLIYYLLSSDMSVLYVAQNSSRELPPLYKFSALWAGQQGSLLVWILFTSIALIPVVRKGSAASIAVASAVVLAMLVILTVWANPFAPNTSSAVSGRGLNPLLQNFWMAVHPPLLFAGYAFTASLYVRAIVSLRSDGAADDFACRRRNLLLSCGFLSLGIASGAVWSYGTLGWGGFWGWDPVENGSLFAWLLSAAALRSELKCRNAHDLLCVLPFISVVLFSFLTRSGLFSDVSVHSFAASPLGAPFGILFAVSLLAPVLYSIIGLRRKTAFAGDKGTTDVSVHLLYIFACILAAGTLLPVVSALFAARPYLLRPSFFSMIALVFASVLFFLYAGRTFAQLPMRRKFFAGAVFAALAVMMVMRIPFDPWIWILAAAASAALSAYLVSGIFSLGKNLALAGFALLTFGCIGYAYLEDSYVAELVEKKEAVADAGCVRLYGFERDSSGMSGSFIYEYIPSGSSEKMTVDLTGRAQGVSIVRHLTHDDHVRPDAYYPGAKDRAAGLLISVEKKPLMNLVWAGFFLVALAPFLLLFPYFRRPKHA